MKSIDQNLLDIKNQLELISNSINIENKQISTRYLYKKMTEIVEVLNTGGYKENVYREALMIELNNDNHNVSEEVVIPVKYKDKILSNVYGKADIVVKDHCVIELKMVTDSICGGGAQVMRYLRGLDLPVGYVIGINKNTNDVNRILVEEFSNPWYGHDKRNTYQSENPDKNHDHNKEVLQQLRKHEKYNIELHTDIGKQVLLLSNQFTSIKERLSQLENTIENLNNQENIVINVNEIKEQYDHVRHSQQKLYDESISDIEDNSITSQDDNENDTLDINAELNKLNIIDNTSETSDDLIENLTKKYSCNNLINKQNMEEEPDQENVEVEASEEEEEEVEESGKDEEEEEEEVEESGKDEEESCEEEEEEVEESGKDEEEEEEEVEESGKDEEEEEEEEEEVEESGKDEEEEEEEEEEVEESCEEEEEEVEESGKDEEEEEEEVEESCKDEEEEVEESCEEEEEEVEESGKDEEEEEEEEEEESGKDEEEEEEEEEEVEESGEDEEEEEEEDEEEVFEIEHEGNDYFTNNETNGILFENNDGEPGNEIGKIVNGKIKLNK